MLILSLLYPKSASTGRQGDIEMHQTTGAPFYLKIIPLDICPFQPAFPGLRVKLPSRMQHPPIRKHNTLPFLKKLLKPHFLPLRNPRKSFKSADKPSPIGLISPRRLFFKGCLERRCIIHMVDIEALWIRGVQDDRWTGKEIMLCVVEVVELDGLGREGLKRLARTETEKGCCAEGVDEDGSPTLHGVAETVEELEARRGGVVHQVHV